MTIPDAPPRPTGDPHHYAASAHHADLSNAEVLAVVAVGFVTAPDQLTALAAARVCLDLAGVEPHLAARLLAFIRVLVLHASWGGPGKAPKGVSSPGRDLVCRRLAISVATYKRYRRWWEEHGLIAIVRPGWTPLTAAARRDPARNRNRSQAYVLCVPRPAEPEPAPAAEPLTGFDFIRAEGRPKPPARVSARGPAKTRLHAVIRPGEWISKLPDPARRYLRRKFPRDDDADFAYRAAYRPDGTPHTRTDGVRHPFGLLAARLSLWLRPDGTPIETPRQRNREQLAEVNGTRGARLRAAGGYESAAPAPQYAWTPPPRQGQAPAGVAARSGPGSGPLPDWWEAVVAAAGAAVVGPNAVTQ